MSFPALETNFSARIGLRGLRPSEFTTLPVPQPLGGYDDKILVSSDGYALSSFGLSTVTPAFNAPISRLMWDTDPEADYYEVAFTRLRNPAAQKRPYMCTPLTNVPLGPDGWYFVRARMTDRRVAEWSLPVRFERNELPVKRDPESEPWWPLLTTDLALAFCTDSKVIMGPAYYAEYGSVTVTPVNSSIVYYFLSYMDGIDITADYEPGYVYHAGQFYAVDLLSCVAGGGHTEIQGYITINY